MKLDEVVRAAFNLAGCLLCAGILVALSLAVLFRLSDALRRR